MPARVIRIYVGASLILSPLKSCASLNVLTLCLLVLSESMALGQTTDVNQMEKFLDRVDQPGDWSTPASPQTTNLAPAQSAPVFNQFGTAQNANQASANSILNRRAIFQTLFGGGPQATKSGSKNFDEIRYNVSNKLQTARDQASRAQSACDRSSYGSDKYARRQAAEEAQYAAQAANSAADAAYSLSNNTNSYISGLASQARSEANRAQASADRASSNANGGGW